MQTENQSTVLSDQQKLFCEEYIIDLNAVKAAIRAGYEENLAQTTAGDLMELAAVRQYIRQLLDKRQRKFEITPQAVLWELAHIAFGRVEDFVVANADGTEPENMKKTVTQSNCKISIEDKATGRRIVYQFNLRDKIRALVALGKHLGIFQADIAEFLRQAPFVFPPVALK